MVCCTVNVLRSVTNHSTCLQRSFQMTIESNLAIAIATRFVIGLKTSGQFSTIEKQN